MIGVTGSRHINSRRRGSSPSINPQISAALAARRLSTQVEEETEDESKDSKEKVNKSESQHSGSPSPSIDNSATTSGRQSKIVSVPNASHNGSRSQARLSVPDLPSGARFRQRRRAVEISDQRTCVLLHSRLKGMKLEDIA
jgi:hypothetical protein